MALTAAAEAAPGSMGHFWVKVMGVSSAAWPKIGQKLMDTWRPYRKSSSPAGASMWARREGSTTASECYLDL